MAHKLDARIVFHDDLQVMEVDFTDYRFNTSKDVNEFYDRLEERIAESGENLWFFLVNYSSTRIDPSAWFAFSQRGKTLNLAHSQGSVRLDPSEETKAEIARRSKTDAFDANLFSDRESALARLAALPTKRRRKTVHELSYGPDECARRLSFLDDLQVMDVNFSNVTFAHSADVNAFYDHIEDRARETGKKWFFLVDYNNCRINPEAWVSYAQRGKKLNIEFGLGSVRYATGSETEQEICLRAESQDFRPNIRNTRQEALERIEEMKLENS